MQQGGGHPHDVEGIGQDLGTDPFIVFGIGPFGLGGPVFVRIPQIGVHQIDRPEQLDPVHAPFVVPDQGFRTIQDLTADRAGGKLPA